MHFLSLRLNPVRVCLLTILAVAGVFAILPKEMRVMAAKNVENKVRRRLGMEKTVSDRIREIEGRRPEVRRMVKSMNGPPQVLAFKKERCVEVIAPGIQSPLVFPMTAFSGDLGPKLREGDGQIPEGIYSIEYLNPNSNFHLSAKVSYPNKSDLKRAETDGRKRLGGDIMIHGGAATIGCIPIGDEAIETLFCILAAVPDLSDVKVVIAPYDMRKGRRKELEEAVDVQWYHVLCDEIQEALTERPFP